MKNYNQMTKKELISELSKYSIDNITAKALECECDALAEDLIKARAAVVSERQQKEFAEEALKSAKRDISQLEFDLHDIQENGTVNMKVLLVVAVTFFLIGMMVAVII